MRGSCTGSTRSINPEWSSENNLLTHCLAGPARTTRRRSGIRFPRATRGGISSGRTPAAGRPLRPRPTPTTFFNHMLDNPFNDSVTVLDGRVTVHDEAAIASAAMDRLVSAAVFGDPDGRDDARWLIWEIGQAVGVRASSIHDLYLARGRGETGGFTVPAMNIRGMVYDTARALFRAAVKLDVGAFILEIARSEIAYTDQRPAEYVAVMLGAALREGFRGPVFIQGDHFQVNAKKFAVDPVTEVNGVKQLAREAIAAGFYNIDVDTSTLVDLSRPTLTEQQRANYEQGVELALTVRELQPEGITISIG